MNNKEKKYDLIEICMENATCNMKCKYCFGGFIDNHNCHTNKVPDFDPFILDKKLKDIHFFNGTIKFWGGEPLANWDILKKVISYMHVKYPYSHRVLLTNGSLLTKDKVDFFIKYKVHITVSHDGCGQSLRGKDPLSDESIIECIKILRMNELFDDFHSVIHKDSQYLDKQKEYWNNIRNVLNFNFNVTWNLFRATDSWTNIYLPDIDKVLELAKYSLEQSILEFKGNKFKIKFIPNNDIMRPLIPLLFPDKESDEKPCGADKCLTIGLSGKEYLCVTDSERTSGEKELPSEGRKEYKLPDKCYICKYNKYCGGICMVLTKEQRETNCNNYIKIIEFLIDYLYSDPLKIKYLQQLYNNQIPHTHIDCPSVKKLNNKKEEIVDINSVKILEVIDNNES